MPSFSPFDAELAVVAFDRGGLEDWWSWADDPAEIVAWHQAGFTAADAALWSAWTPGVSPAYAAAVRDTVGNPSWWHVWADLRVPADQVADWHRVHPDHGVVKVWAHDGAFTPAAARQSTEDGFLHPDEFRWWQSRTPLQDLPGAVIEAWREPSAPVLSFMNRERAAGHWRVVGLFHPDRFEAWCDCVASIRETFTFLSHMIPDEQLMSARDTEQAGISCDEFFAFVSELEASPGIDGRPFTWLRRSGTMTVVWRDWFGDLAVTEDRLNAWATQWPWYESVAWAHIPDAVSSYQRWRTVYDNAGFDADTQVPVQWTQWEDPNAAASWVDAVHAADVTITNPLDADPVYGSVLVPLTRLLYARGRRPDPAVVGRLAAGASVLRGRLRVSGQSV